MTIQNIEIANYPKSLNANQQAFVKRELSARIVSTSLSKVTLYSFGASGEWHSHTIGSKSEKKLAIFTSAAFYLNSHHKRDYVSGSFEAFGIPLNVSSMQKLNSYDNQEIITSPEGLQVAEFNRDRYTLNIPFDIFGVDCPEHQEIFTQILIKLNAIFEEESSIDSWKKGKDRNHLNQRVQQYFEEASKQELTTKKRQEVEAMTNVASYREELGKAIKRSEMLRKQIALLEAGGDDIAQRVAKDLDMLVQHPLITDVIVLENGKIKFFTDTMYVHDEDDNRYYLGKMNVTLDPRQSDIRFGGDNPRRGYWTAEDPHPHVNGSSGVACLGNISSTIAELSAQNQIYALAMVAIDFLENANTDDPAGRKVVNWDKVDADGNVLPNATTFYCEYCEEEHNEEERVRVTCYESGRALCEDEARAGIDADDNDIWLHPNYTDCYTWSDERDAYVHDDHPMWSESEDEE